jgi:hypothetical protein
MERTAGSVRSSGIDNLAVKYAGCFEAVMGREI